MATARQETRESYESLKHDLRTLRDELRLKAHLASMDLKDEWEKMEPEVDKVWKELSETSVDAARDMKERLVKLRDRVARA